MKSSKGVLKDKKPKKAIKTTPTKRQRPAPLSCFNDERKKEWEEFLDLYFDDERYTEIKTEGEAIMFTYNTDHNVSLDFGDGMGVAAAYNDNFDYFDSNTITEIVEQVCSHFMDADGGGDDGEYFVDSGEEERDVAPEDDKDLATEISNFKIMFGEEYLALTPHYSMKNLETIMKLPPLDLLRMTTAQAWGVDPKTPLLIKVDVPYENYYQNSQPPKIECFQMDEDGLKKKKVKLGVQVQNLLNSFAKYHWKEVCFHSIKKLGPEDAGKYRTLETEPLPKKEAPGIPERSSKEQKKLVKQLVAMGFKKTHCQNALTYVQSVEDAVELLTNNDKRIQKPNPTPRLAAEQPNKLSRSGNKKKAPRVDGFFSQSNLALKCETDEEKWQCSRDFGFLCMVMAYARRRLPTLNNFCVNCDKPHVFTSGSMLKPAVCSRELCVWAFQQLGVGSEAAGEIATEAEVVDLLVAMAKISSRGARRELVFDPYPQLYDPDNPEKCILDPKSKDWNLLQKLIDSIPSVQAMTQADDFVSMKENMEKTNKLAFPMLQWIISSNRSHIVQLPAANIVKGMVTPFQYLLLSDSPEKEEKFREAKKQYGTIFACHGSAIENWHGIMRRGLINASGSKLQANGAAYGSGIYLSPAAATSFGYCAMGSYNQTAPAHQALRFLDTSKPLGCIAICEVVDKDIRKSGDIWVHPHQDFVCTRFFFVYPDHKVGSSTQFRTDNAAHAKELLTTLELYK